MLGLFLKPHLRSRVGAVGGVIKVMMRSLQSEGEKSVWWRKEVGEKQITGLAASVVRVVDVVLDCVVVEITLVAIGTCGFNVETVSSNGSEAGKVRDEGRMKGRLRMNESLEAIVMGKLSPDSH